MSLLQDLLVTRFEATMVKASNHCEQSGLKGTKNKGLNKTCLHNLLDYKLLSLGQTGGQQTFSVNHEIQNKNKHAEISL